MNDRLTRMLAGEPTEDLQRNIKQYIEERYEVVKRLEWLNRELDTLMRELDRRDEIKRSQRAQTITWEQLTKDQQTILSYLLLTTFDDDPITDLDEDYAVLYELGLIGYSRADSTAEITSAGKAVAVKVSKQ